MYSRSPPKVHTRISLLLYQLTGAQGKEGDMRVIRAGGEADVRDQSEATNSVCVPGEGLDDLSVLPELDCLVGGAYMNSESVQEGGGMHTHPSGPCPHPPRVQLARSSRAL